MKILPNLGLPTSEQWLKIAKVFIYAFASSFIGVLTLAGGFSDEKEANIALIVSGTIAGINAGLVAIKTTFFDKAE